MKELEILNKIKPVSPPSDLYDRIQLKIGKFEVATVPMSWVRAVAAIFICLIAIEGWQLFQTMQDDSTGIQFLIPSVSNDLYHE
ncbi:MAG: hypothetical protein N4A41_04045 [Crocinitomicaceae bacterium]|jgi:hypothetical protein|nr:hypothetical protein [Crocinitomicaceae bacterium]